MITFAQARALAEKHQPDLQLVDEMINELTAKIKAAATSGRLSVDVVQQPYASWTHDNYRQLGVSERKVIDQLNQAGFLLSNHLNYLRIDW